MPIPPVLAAIRHVLSPELRSVLLRAIGMTVVLLGAVWGLLTHLLGRALEANPVAAEQPFLSGLAVLLAGAGLLVAFALLLPAVSSVVSGFFLDDAAAIVERREAPGEPGGTPLSLGRSLLVGGRFALLALAVNGLALLLLLVPGVNLVAFFAANTYLLGREYFTAVAMRFRPEAEARELYRQHRFAALSAGAVMAGLLLVPILNLATPIFGIALMSGVHRRVAGRGAPALERTNRARLG